MRISSSELRPMIDRLSICFVLRTPSRAPVSVWMISVWAATVMVCLLADFQAHVDAAHVVGVQDDAFLLVRLESLEFRLQIEGAGEHTAEEVLAAVVSDRGLSHLGALIGDRDRDPWQHGAAGIFDMAAQRRRGRRRLAKCSCRRARQDGEENDGVSQWTNT
jgi:hypothetical protein